MTKKPTKLHDILTANPHVDVERLRRFQKAVKSVAGENYSICHPFEKSSQTPDSFLTVSVSIISNSK